MKFLILQSNFIGVTKENNVLKTKRNLGENQIKKDFSFNMNKLTNKNR